jgi:hypothetical protein
MFVAHEISSWNDFKELVAQQSDSKWVYRGESCRDWCLSSPLERALQSWGLGLDLAANIEWQTIRDFRRRYKGADRAEVCGDVLYCLATMQHHRAPTRLVDWTYSPYVAARFAVEAGSRAGAVYCLDYRWCEVAAHAVADSVLLTRRDRRRDDRSFRKLYLESNPPKRFVFTENAFHLNSRLAVQQGLFLCPGDVSVPFVENLKSILEAGSPKGRLIKVRFDLSVDCVRQFASQLTRMNIDSAALFPGVDGFARSLGERIPLYAKLASDLGPPRRYPER